MAIHIRAARADELDKVGELTYAAYTWDRPVSSTYAAHLRDAAGRAGHADLLVAVDGGEIVGTVAVAYCGRRWADIARPHEAEVRMLAVAPERRGEGIGAELTRACIEIAAQRDARRVVLSTRPWMTAAQRMYERVGFSRVPDRDWDADGPLLVYAYDL